MEKMYLISQEEVKELYSSKSSETRMKIMVDVLARPFVERSALSAISDSVGKCLDGLGAWLDKIGEGKS